MEKKNKKGVLNIEENVEALLAYVLGWVSGLIFLVIEKENKFVRFHAMQSLITFLFLMVFSWIVAIIPFIGPLLVLVINILTLALWIILMIKAYRGEKYKLPIIGDIAEKQIK